MSLDNLRRRIEALEGNSPDVVECGDPPLSHYEQTLVNMAASLMLRCPEIEKGVLDLSPLTMEERALVHSVNDMIMKKAEGKQFG